MIGWQLAVWVWVFVAGIVAEGVMEESDDICKAFDDHPTIPYVVKFAAFWVSIYVVCLCWPAILMATIGRR